MSNDSADYSPKRARVENVELPNDVLLAIQNKAECILECLENGKKVSCSETISFIKSQLGKVSGISAQHFIEKLASFIWQKPNEEHTSCQLFLRTMPFLVSKEISSDLSKSVLETEMNSSSSIFGDDPGLHLIYLWKNQISIDERQQISAEFRSPAILLFQWLLEFGVLSYAQIGRAICLDLNDQALSIRDDLKAGKAVSLLKTRDFLRDLLMQALESVSRENPNASRDLIHFIGSIVRTIASYIWPLTNANLVSRKLFVDKLPVVILAKLRMSTALMKQDVHEKHSNNTYCENAGSHCLKGSSSIDTITGSITNEEEIGIKKTAGNVHPAEIVPLVVSEEISSDISKSALDMNSSISVFGDDPGPHLIYLWKNQISTDERKEISEEWGFPSVVAFQWLSEFGIADYQESAKKVCFDLRKYAMTIHDTLNKNRAVSLVPTIEYIVDIMKKCISGKKFILKDPRLIHLVESFVDMICFGLWQNENRNSVARKLVGNNLPVLIISELTLVGGGESQQSATRVLLNHPESIFSKAAGSHCIRTRGNFTTISITEVNFETSSNTPCTSWTVKGLPNFMTKRYGLGDEFELFHRKCYKSLFDILEKSLNLPRNILITGVPGIGKSFFSIYVLLSGLIKESFPVREFFIEYKADVYWKISLVELTSWENRSISLKVSVEENCKPCGVRDFVLSDISKLEEPGCGGTWNCIFSSPNPARYKQAIYNLHPEHNARYTMPTWSELELGAAVPANVNWQERFKKFGGVPRYLFQRDTIERNPRQEDGNDIPRDCVVDVLTKAVSGEGIAIVLHWVRFGYHILDQSCELIHFNPIWDEMRGDWNYHETEELEYASEWVAKELFELFLNRVMEENVTAFDSNAARTRWGCGKAGTWFEKILIWSIPIDEESLIFTPLPGSPAGLEAIEVTFPRFVTLSTFWKQQAASLQLDHLYRPISDHMGNRYCFGVFKVNGEYALVVVQVTLGAEHGIRMNELKTIFQAYSSEDQRKIKKKILAFMTDAHSELNSTQSITTTNGEVAENVLSEAQGFEQYVHRVRFSQRTKSPIVRRPH